MRAEKPVAASREFLGSPLDALVSNAALVQFDQGQLDEEREKPSTLELDHGPADLEAVQVAGLLAVQVQAVLDHGDVATVLEVEGEELGVEYEIEGRKILTDEGTMKIKYLARVTDTGEYDASLIEVLSARIAHEIAYPLTNSNTVAEQLWNLYLQKLSECRFVDATEGTPAEIIATDYTNARR